MNEADIRAATMHRTRPMPERYARFLQAIGHDLPTIDQHEEQCWAERHEAQRINHTTEGR